MLLLSPWFEVCLCSWKLCLSCVIGMARIAIVQGVINFYWVFFLKECKRVSWLVGVVSDVVWRILFCVLRERCTIVCSSLFKS